MEAHHGLESLEKAWRSLFRSLSILGCAPSPIGSIHSLERCFTRQSTRRATVYPSCADRTISVFLPGFRSFATARGCQVSLNYDAEIIRLGESAHAAFPEVPLLGFDMVREVPSGKLYILEANAIGYIWKCDARTAEDYGFSFEEQFDGLRKAAFILAEKTQQLAW